MILAYLVTVIVWADVFVQRQITGQAAAHGHTRWQWADELTLWETNSGLCYKAWRSSNRHTKYPAPGLCDCAVGHDVGMEEFGIGRSRTPKERPWKAPVVD
jgi:hypothetical protein